ncbi:MAG: TlpA disulfide reductase family protein [Isosphaeraceae bacterium]|nr:TlpA disulfide reductase family protein [Isosphaeraceae bacterium]
MTRLTTLIGGLTSALALLGLVAPAGADETTGALPRYRLKVGQELKYHGTSDFKYENGSFGYKTDWQVWVVGANDDGSWRLVLRSSNLMTRKDNGRELGGGSADVTLAYCDLFPDGRIVPNDSFGFRLDPSSIFPRLPKDAAEVKDGWRDVNLRQGNRTEFRRSARAANGPDEWVFEGVRNSPTDKIYLSSHQATYVFDAKRGLVARVESENSQGYGFKGKGTGTEELTAVEAQDAGRAQTFAAESARYFEANKAYQALLEKAGKDAKEVDALLARGEKVLKDAREALNLPVLREQVDEQLKSHKQMASYYAEEAKNRAAVLGHDAAEWETKDLDGKSHSLKGYRGKVVILDFWYRGCGWCIRAMPQVKELSDDFKGEPVAVLGMNTDKDEKDARLVVEEMGLTYPTLKAEGLPEKYHVRGFPTLIIIDQEGKVADVHVGYSPTLREEVSKSVKSLLSRK